jgi:hypothetical protein
VMTPQRPEYRGNCRRDRDDDEATALPYRADDALAPINLRPFKHEAFFKALAAGPGEAQERLVVRAYSLVESPERLTIQHETDRLKRLGVDVPPRWMAIEDNTVGYDVLSYELSQYGLNNVLIEVKSTVASPLRFIVTRNEWDEAQKFGDAYVFHVWDLDKNPEILHVRTSAQVAPHIPADNQQGKWQNAIIPVGASSYA